jgi:plastocyanin
MMLERFSSFSPRRRGEFSRSKGRTLMSARRMCTSLVLAASLVLGTVLASGAVAGGRHTATRATKTVKGIVTHWSPTTVAISTRDTIKWKAVIGTHSVTAYGGNWRFNHDMLAGQAVHRIFRQAGTFRFRCTFHSTLTNGQCSGMCGKVVVRS